MPTMKLQKLVYYCQAWAMARLGDAMFPERIEAWTNGPVVPDLWRVHKGDFYVSTVGGSADSIDQRRRAIVDAITDFYGPKSANDLINLTHAEAPWIDARKGLPPEQRATAEISRESMRDYYSRL
jgi:uncharacterized phage-associated protein